MREGRPVSAGRSYRRRLGRGRVVYVGPEVREDATTALKNAMALRNVANISGRCPSCGATFVLDRPLRPGEISTAVMEHEGGCPVLLTEVSG